MERPQRASARTDDVDACKNRHMLVLARERAGETAERHGFRELSDGIITPMTPKPQAMTPKPAVETGAVAGVVKWFDADEGWGVIEAPEVPGGCFVHFSRIEMDGYRQLRAGQQVRFTFERPGFLQDGCPYRVLSVWPAV